MKSLVLTAAISLSLVTGMQPAWAHHSAAMFDFSKDVTVTAVVKSWRWTNPHSWLTVLVDDGQGHEVIQPLEAGSPNTMFRSGWRADMFKPGDKVTVMFHPSKDGNPGGALMTVTTAEGKLMSWLPTAEKPAGSKTESSQSGTPAP